MEERLRRPTAMAASRMSRLSRLSVTTSAKPRLSAVRRWGDPMIAREGSFNEWVFMAT